MITRTFDEFWAAWCASHEEGERNWRHQGGLEACDYPATGSWAKAAAQAAWQAAGRKL